ncbi:hypothetical protein OK074_1617 [Actinobacteria bacterium OK074]|nr:hypothetical protein OK074_1617 [Actinobacteria bacterium OK074]
MWGGAITEMREFFTDAWARPLPEAPGPPFADALAVPVVSGFVFVSPDPLTFS